MGVEAAAVLNALKAGRFRISLHAARRMLQRSVTKADIQACARSATACTCQVENRTCRVQGEDLDDEPLTVVCGVDNGTVVIVTLY